MFAQVEFRLQSRESLPREGSKPSQPPQEDRSQLEAPKELGSRQTASKLAIAENFEFPPR